MLDYIKGTVVLLGIKRPSQLLSNIEVIGWSLTELQIKELNDICKD